MKLVLDTNVLIAAFIAKGLCHSLLSGGQCHLTYLTKIATKA